MLNHDQLQNLLREVRHRTDIPGLVVATTSSTQELSVADGIASLDTNSRLTGECRFQLGCITKLLTSLVVVELARTHVLDLRAPLAQYIAEFQGVPKAQDIQIQHLASHTSGYQGLNIASPEVAYFYSWKKFAEYFTTAPQLFKPGTVFNYEHSEAVILGEVVRRVTGASTAELMRQLIFEPLGFNAGRFKSDSSQPQFHVADHGRDSAGGNYKTLRTVPYSAFWLSSLSDITLSTSDLLALGREMINPTRSRLGRETVLKCQHPVVRVPWTAGGGQHEQMPLSFGLGCAEYAGQLLGHNGSARGQTCAFRFSPPDDVVVVVALNAWQPYLRDWLVNRTADARDTARSHPLEGTQTSPWKFEELEGSYAGCIQGVTLDAHKKHDKLVCDVINKATDSALRIEVAYDRAGRLVIESDVSHLSLGFFRENESGAPCIMLAMNAFKRAA